MKYEIKLVQDPNRRRRVKAMTWLVDAWDVAYWSLAGRDVRTISFYIIEGTTKQDFHQFGLDAINHALDYRLGLEAIVRTREMVSEQNLLPFRVAVNRLGVVWSFLEGEGEWAGAVDRSSADACPMADGCSVATDEG